MLPFWISIVLLSLAQGALVALPRSLRVGWLERMRSRRWAVIPPLSIVAFVLIASAAESASAQGLTYLALVAVPVLAALALGWLSRGARPARALLVAPLFALAWADNGGLAGQAAGLVLSGLSCVALGVLLAAVTPPRWLAAGIVTMALADTALVVSDLLQKPNDALNAAHPVAGLPQLQSEVLGSAVMGYGDIFIAGALGALLASMLGRSPQLRGAALTVLLASAFDLLFFLVDELPATVPVAAAMVLVLLSRRRSDVRRDRARAQGPADSTLARRSRAPAVR
jgi:drug/metabolite transporter superfamily protein YnfA